MKFAVAALVAVFSTCAADSDRSWVMMGKQSGPKHAWQSSALLGEKGEHDPTHELVFAVRQSGIDVLEQTLKEVSDPSHARYGKYLSFDAVGRITENREATDSVMRWLEAASVNASATKYGEFVRATATTSVWNRLLNTHFQRFTTSEGESVIRSLSYSLPRSMHKHLDCVMRASELPPIFTKRQSRRMDRSFGADRPYVFPSVLNKVYSISDNSGKNRGSQSVFETTGQNYSPEDLALFQRNYSLPVAPIAFNIGGNNDSLTCKIQSYKCSEANLDTQFITAVAQDTPTWFWSVEMTTFAEWLTTVASTPNSPLVHSVSYGQYESETGAAEFKQFNQAAMKLGVQGKSVVVSSGDDGVSGNKARTSTGLCDYQPQWPATSPYVTAVGATQGPEQTSPTPEVG
jgi:tripeptidyl-peptidase-1